MYEKCRGPFLTIFGDTKAIKPHYVLTGFLNLYPSGKRENERKKSLLHSLKRDHIASLKGPYGQIPKPPRPRALPNLRFYYVLKGFYNL